MQSDTVAVQRQHSLSPGSTKAAAWSAALSLKCLPPHFELLYGPVSNNT